MDFAANPLFSRVCAIVDSVDKFRSINYVKEFLPTKTPLCGITAGGVMFTGNPHSKVPVYDVVFVDNVYNLLSQKTVCHFYYVSRTHGYQQITGGTILQEVILNFVK